MLVRMIGMNVVCHSLSFPGLNSVGFASVLDRIAHQIEDMLIR